MQNLTSNRSGHILTIVQNLSSFDGAASACDSALELLAQVRRQLPRKADRPEHVQPVTQMLLAVPRAAALAPRGRRLQAAGDVFQRLQLQNLRPPLGQRAAQVDLQGWRGRQCGSVQCSAEQCRAGKCGERAGRAGQGISRPVRPRQPTCARGKVSSSSSRPCRASSTPDTSVRVTTCTCQRSRSYRAGQGREGPGQRQGQAPGKGHDRHAGG